jgi:16S rRNA (cytidine1402-2'-O)-methyltransferase
MLYLVATPIGNLGDITLRALEVLREVDFVASEDTRKTGILLKHFDIQKPQIAFHEHNERQAGDRIVGLLKQGKSVAVVSDAGTPGISDPGYTLVRRCVEEDLEVTMAPGPAGLIMALVLSGLPVHSFTFRGFAPRKPGPRRRFLEIDRDSPHTLIFYESPYRIAAFLKDALEVYGDREAAIANDLTKLFETVLRGTLSTLLQESLVLKPKGEYIVVIAGVVRKSHVDRDDYDANADRVNNDTGHISPTILMPFIYD